MPTGLVGMGDNRGCAPKRCNPTRTFIDVVQIGSVGAERLRFFNRSVDGTPLGAATEQVWFCEIDDVDSHEQISYAPSYPGSMLLAATIGGDDLTIHKVNLRTGVDLGALATFENAGPAAFMWQESGTEVSFKIGESGESDCAGEESDTGSLRTVNYDGDLATFSTFVPEDYGGGARVGDIYGYVYSSSLREIWRLYPDEVEPAELWVDTSPYVTASGSRIFYDDGRELMYLIGFNSDGDVAVYSINIDDTPTVTLLTTSASLDTAPTSLTAVTLLPDGIWWYDYTLLAFYRYDFGDNAVVVALKQITGFWPLIGNCDFIVGIGQTCDTECACSPTVTLTRVDRDPEDFWAERCPGAEVPEDVYELIDDSCFYIFEYEISLCGGRSLYDISFFGQRGNVFINGVPLSSIEDFSELPLTGEIAFAFITGPGHAESTAYMVVTDDNFCCVEEPIQVNCCECSEPSGSISIETDTVPEDMELEFGISPGTSCANPSGGPDECGSLHHYYCYYKVVFGEVTTTDCGENGSNLGHYRVNWDGLRDRDGDLLVNGCYGPGDEVRVRHDAGALGQCSCPEFYVYDSIDCLSGPHTAGGFAFRHIYCFDEDDVPSECAEAHAVIQPCPPADPWEP